MSEQKRMHYPAQDWGGTICGRRGQWAVSLGVKGVTCAHCQRILRRIHPYIRKIGGAKP